MKNGNKKKRGALRPLKMAVAMALAALAATASAATASTPASRGNGSPCQQVDVGPLLKVAVGKSTVIRPESPIARILLGNPDHAQAGRPSEGAAPPAGAPAGGNQQNQRRPGVADVDVLLLSPNELYILGKTIGSTNVVLLDRDGACMIVDIAVGLDTTAVAATLGDLLPAESGIKVSSAADSLVLYGMVSDATAADRAVELANAYVRRATGGGAGRGERVVNMLSVSAPQQVMLEVKVAEVSKSLLDQFGIDFSRAFAAADGSKIRFLSGLLGGAALTAGQIGGTGPGNVPFSSVDAVVGGTVRGVPGAAGGNVTVTFDAQGRPTYTTTFGTVPGRSVTNVQANMQKTDGLVKVLAEPNVMAISGQEGSFLAGGKIFIPVISNNAGGGSTVTLEEKEFGVSLKFTPTVLSGGRINLKVSPEVSELSAQGIAITASTLSGTQILPAFTTRRAATTVELMDGQSFAIGGLIKNNVTTNISAFPILGELPILGALFRSTSFQTDRSELVFVITPRLVKPLPPNYALPTDAYVEPSRADLILGGRMEGRPKKDETPPAQPAPAPAQPEAPAQGGFEVK